MINVNSLQVGDKVRRAEGYGNPNYIYTVDTNPDGKKVARHNGGGLTMNFAFPHKWELVESVSDHEGKIATKLEELARASEEVTRLAKEIAELKAQKSKRRDTIKKAAEDVEDLTKRMSGGETNKEGNFTFRNMTTVPEFHVNKKKGVVTALAKGLSGGKVFEKNFARCAPGDVFSEEVGKAIALRRALKLEVPQEYLTLPNN